MPLRPGERCGYALSRVAGSVRAYVNLMLDAFGWRFLLVLAFVQCFVNGIVFMAVNDSVFPLLKHLGVQASQLQILATLSMAPWALKPLLGVLSDTVALGRYHKRYWMVWACIVGLVGTMVLSTGPYKELGVLVAMLFMVNFQIAFTDLLIEAKYAELMNERPDTGSNIVTLKMAAQQLGFVVALFFVGPLSDAEQFTTIYVVCVVFAASPILLLLFGFLPEQPAQGTQRGCRRVVRVDTHKMRRNVGMLLTVVMVGVCGPLFSLWTALNLPDNELLTRALGVGGSVLLLVLGVAGGYRVFPRVVANVILYQVLTSLLSIRVGTALDFFYTADAACLPGGPHFSYRYYITLTGTLSVCVGLVSVALYQLLFSGWRFRNVILLTTALSGVAGLFDLAMVLRWNVALGIPDKAFYVVGESILERAVGMLLYIPSTTIIGKVCPAGLQAATYAYLAGMSNLAGNSASLMGAAIIDLAGLQMQPLLPLLNATNASSALHGNLTSFGTSPERLCVWDNLWWLVLVGHVVCRVLVGIPAAFLIPNTPQDEPIAGVSQAEQHEEEGAVALGILNELSLSDLESDAELDL